MDMDDELIELPPPVSESYMQRLQRAAELKEYAARDNGEPPGYFCTNRVVRRGDPLSPVIWQGRQWAATTFGLEARDGCYFIQADRLWENEEQYGWVRHLASKTWVDLDDLAEAVRIARRVHNHLFKKP
jgi:hypothetical protein